MCGFCVHTLRASGKGASARSRAPRPGLLGAQGRRRRKAAEEGGKDEEKKRGRRSRMKVRGALERGTRGEMKREAKERREW